MKFKLLRYNNTPIDFDMNSIISITANGNLIYVKFRFDCSAITEHVTHVGYCIVKNE